MVKQFFLNTMNFQTLSECVSWW